MSFSAHDRQSIFKKMSNEQFDILVIGGGITGCGIALDSVTRGMKTCLIEMQDFAAGTSSRSTKLVHGGLRYLKQLEIKMVADIGKERKIVYENGPHVTTPEWMVLPIYKNGTLGKTSTSLGLRLYDTLAAVKKTERRKMLSKKATLKKEPLLKSDHLKGSGYYVEYKTDDARLTMEVIKEAVNRGALALNYVKAKNLLYKDGKAVGVTIYDLMDHKTAHIYAAKIINATGPWVDLIREIDSDPKRKEKYLIHTKGVHLVFDRGKFPLRHAVYFDTPDRRMMFAIPREGKTYVGTTDTFYEEDLTKPKVTLNDADYILSAIAHMFPNVNLSHQDIESSWVGLRPLISEKGKSPSEISRKDEIWQSPTGLISVAGGKLTGYRKMAEEVIDFVAAQFKKEQKIVFDKCVTKQLPISGGHVGGARNFPDFIKSRLHHAADAGLTEEQYIRLVKKYGSNIDNLLKIGKEQKQKANLPLDLLLEVIYSLNEEMVIRPTDFFIRRSGLLLFQVDTVYKWKKDIIQIMSDTLKWTSHQKQLFTRELEDEIKKIKVSK